MKVKFFATFRDYTGTKELEFEYCSTLEDLLLRLCDKYGRKFSGKVFSKEMQSSQLQGSEILSSEIIILINGIHISHLNGIKSKLDVNDEISIFPVVAGG